MDFLEKAKANYKKIVFFVFLGGLLLIVITGFVAVKTFNYLLIEAKKELYAYSINKKINAEIIDPVIAIAEINTMVKLHISKKIKVSIPVSEEISVVIDEDFTAPVKLDLNVPLNQNIDISARIPVNLELPLRGAKIYTSMFGVKKIPLPATGVIKFKSTIPFKARIPVKMDFPLKLSENITVHLKKKLKIPLKMKVNTAFLIDETFDVLLKARIRAKAKLDVVIPADVQIKADPLSMENRVRFF